MLSLVKNKNTHTELMVFSQWRKCFGSEATVTCSSSYLRTHPLFTETESTLIACLAVLVCFKDHWLSVSILPTFLSISLRFQKARLRPRLHRRLKQTARQVFKRELSACFGNGSCFFLDRHESKSTVLNP